MLWKQHKIPLLVVLWTERIGPTAALKSLEVMEREKSWESITKTGTKYRESLHKLANKHGLDIIIWIACPYLLCIRKF